MLLIKKRPHGCQSKKIAYNHEDIGHKMSIMKQ